MNSVDKINNYKHLGNDFLTWLYFETDTMSTEFIQGNKIILSKDKESISIKGESDLIIGKVALSDGFVVTQMTVDVQSYSFSLKGADLCLNGLRMPKVEGDGSKDEIDGMILEKIYLIEEVFRLFDDIFKEYIKIRINNWPETVQKIKRWINEG